MQPVVRIGIDLLLVLAISAAAIRLLPAELCPLCETLRAASESPHSPNSPDDSTTSENDRKRDVVDWRVMVSQSWNITLVADLDWHSRDPTDFVWLSYLKKTTLRLDSDLRFRVAPFQTQKIQTNISRKNRSLELSELLLFKGNLLSFCDYTGLVYRIDDTKLFLRYALADGNGKEEKPFKSEWATAKDGFMYVGSLGKEWVENGKVLHRNMEWVKRIDSCGNVENLDWTGIYDTLRAAANASNPGYLSHEAVVWHPERRMWIFVPRRASHGVPYTEEDDERLVLISFHGTNLIITASEDFSDIKVARVGELNTDLGFTSIKLLPGTDVLVGLKVYERFGDPSSTWFMVFDTQGNILSDPPMILVDSAQKYEGVEIF